MRTAAEDGVVFAHQYRRASCSVVAWKTGRELPTSAQRASVRAEAPETWEYSMIKADLVQRVAADADITGAQAKRAVDATFESIAGELAAGRDVAIAGFGKFSPSKRSAREGRNPATGETIQISARTAAKFSPAAALKKQLNT